jgi:hypothetical protein
MVSIEEIQTAYYMVAATGVLIAAVYYIYNMRATRKTQELALKAQELSLKSQEQNLVTRQAQLFMQLYSQYYDKDWLEALHKTAFDMSFKDYNDFVAKYGPKENPDAYKSFDILSHYFEGAGVMAKNGLINPTMVAELFSEEFKDYWEKFSPIFIEYRRRSNNPKVCENQEYLYSLLKSMLPAETLTESKLYQTIKNN